MLQLVNLTDFQCERALLTNVDGSHVLAVVLKATFDLRDNAEAVWADEQEPVALAPRYLNDDPEATLLRDAEMTLDHPGTDVIVNASAYAPDGQEVTSLNASVIVGGVGAALRVTGDRRWKRTLRGVVPDEPEPFQRMPVTYDRAFGGGHAIEEEPGRIWDARNPVGHGYCSDPGELVGTPVPNIEDRAEVLTRAAPGEIVPVAGLSARPQSWEPRKALAGTYDDAWEQDRMPFWPADLDPGFFRAATPALQLDKALRGHETVVLKNLTPEGEARYRIPRQIPTVRTRLLGNRVTQEVNLRRVIIEPDLGKMVLVWRSVLNCGVHGRQVEKVTVDQRPIVRAGTAVSA